MWFMRLLDYLHENGITQAAFGRLLTPPVSQGKVNHWLHGARRVSLIEALQIERLTQGQVTLQDLAQLGHPKSPAHRVTASTCAETIDIQTAAAGQGE